MITCITLTTISQFPEKKFFFKFCKIHWKMNTAEFTSLRPATLLKRNSGTTVSCEFCEIYFVNVFFTEHLRTTVSGNLYSMQIN